MNEGRPRKNPRKGSKNKMAIPIKESPFYYNLLILLVPAVGIEPTRSRAPRDFEAMEKSLGRQLTYRGI